MSPLGTPWTHPSSSESEIQAFPRNVSAVDRDGCVSKGMGQVEKNSLHSTPFSANTLKYPSLTYTFYTSPDLSYQKYPDLS